MLKVIKRIIIFIVVIMLCGTLLIGYAFLIEPKRVVKSQYQLNSIGKNKGKQTDKTIETSNKVTEEKTSLTVVQFSDVHVSRYYAEKELKKIVEEINQINPDIIVFTGDLYDNFSTYSPVDIVVEQFSKLNAKYGKYAVWGNHDYGGGAARDYSYIIEDSGFTLLTNESVVIELENGKTVGIGGIDDFIFGNPDIDKTLQGMKDASYQIILMHEPDEAELFKNSKANLILTGHSHGGQVRIPGIKITPPFAKVYTEGFYTLNEETNLQLYVNTGLGTTRIPARFLVPPEIAVFDIQF